MGRKVHQMRTPRPRIIIRVDRRDITRQTRYRPPRAHLVPPTFPLSPLHPYDRRSRLPPSIALPKLHVIILAPRRTRLVRDAPLCHFTGTDRDERSEFARPGTAAVATEGELAGDLGGEVAEEVGHGDEAAADDAGCDFGDAIVAQLALEMRPAGARGSGSRPHCDGK